MKKVYKLFSVITLAICTVFLIVGCGKKTTKDTKTTKKDNTTNVTTAKKTTSKKTTSKSTTKNNETTKETKNSYSISVENEISGVTCSVSTLASNGGTATYVPVDITEKQEEGKAIFVTVTNYSSKSVKLTATIGTTVKEATIRAGESGGFQSPYDCLTLTGDLNLKIETIDEVVTKSRITLDNDSEVIFSFYYYVGGTKYTCNSSTELANGTMIYPSVTSTLDFDIVAAYAIDGNLIQKLELSAGSLESQKAEFTPFEVTGNVNFDYVIDEECKLEFSSEVEDAYFVITNKTTDEEVTVSGFYYDILTEFEFGLANKSGKKIIVNAYQYETEEDDMVLITSFPIEDESFTYPKLFILTSDVRLEIVEYAEYEVSYDTLPDSDIVLNFSYIDFSTYSSKELEAGTYPKGTIIYAAVYNKTDRKILVRVVDKDNDTSIITSFNVAAYDHMYADDYFALSCDIRVNIVFDEPVIPSYTLTIDNDYSDVIIDAYYFVDDVTPTLITSTTQIPYGSSILITGKNFLTDSTIKMSLLIADEVANYTIINAGYDNEGQLTLTSIESDIKVLIEIGEEVTTYSIEDENEITGLDIELYYEDGDEYIKIIRTNCILENSVIYVKAINSTDNDYVVLVNTDGGNSIISGAVAANEEVFIGSFTLKEDSHYEAIEYSEVTVTYESTEDVTITCYDQNNIKVLSGAKVFKGRILYFDIENKTNNKVSVIVKMLGYDLGFIVDANSSETAGPLNVPSDITITIDEYVEYNVSITNSFAPNVNIMFMIITPDGSTQLKDGDKVAKNATAMLFIRNQTDKILMLTITNGSETLYNGTLEQFYGDESPIAIKGDFSITITEAIVPLDSFIIANNMIDGLDLEITVDGENHNLEDAIEEGAVVSITITNNTEDSYIIFVLDEDDNNIVSSKIVEPNDTITFEFEIDCDVYLENETDDVTNKYTITNSVSEFSVEITIGDDEDFDPDAEYEEGTLINLYLNNETEVAYMFYVLDEDDNNVIEPRVIKPEDGPWIQFNIYSNVYITCEEYVEEGPYKVWCDVLVVDFSINLYVDEEAISFGDDIESGTAVEVDITNDTEYVYWVYVLRSLDDELLVSHECAASSTDFFIFEITCNCYIEFEVEELEEGPYSIEISDDTNSTVNVYYITEDDEEIEIDLEEKYADDTSIKVYVTNNNDYLVRVYVVDSYDYTLTEAIIDPDYTSHIEFTLGSDVIIYLEEYIEEYYTYISNNSGAMDDDIIVIVTDSDNNDVTEENIAGITDLKVTVSNNSEYDIIIVVFDDDETFIFDAVILAGKEATIDFEHSKDVGINIYDFYESSITIEGEVDGFELKIRDDYNCYYENGDNFNYYGDDLRFEGINSSLDKMVKMTIYIDGDKNVMFFYPGDEEEPYSNFEWYDIYGDIRVVIEEAVMEAFTLTIESEWELEVTCGDDIIYDGSTIHTGDRIRASFDNTTDEIISVTIMDSDGIVLSIIKVYPESYDYCYISGVYSDITIELAVDSPSSEDDPENPEY